MARKKKVVESEINTVDSEQLTVQVPVDDTNTGPVIVPYTKTEETSDALKLEVRPDMLNLNPLMMNRKQRRAMAKATGMLRKKATAPFNEWLNICKRTQDAGKMIWQLKHEQQERALVLRQQQQEEAKLKQLVESGKTVDEAYDIVYGKK